MRAFVEGCADLSKSTRGTSPKARNGCRNLTPRRGVGALAWVRRTGSTIRKKNWSAASARGWKRARLSSPPHSTIRYSAFRVRHEGGRIEQAAPSPLGIGERGLKRTTHNVDAAGGPPF